MFKTTGAVGYIFGSISGPVLISLVGPQRVYVLYGVLFLMFSLIALVILPKLTTLSEEEGDDEI